MSRNGRASGHLNELLLGTLAFSVLAVEVGGIGGIYGSKIPQDILTLSPLLFGL